MLLRGLVALFFALALWGGSGNGVSAQVTNPASGLASDPARVETRVETGGAQTLEDILARQRGEKVDYTFRRDALGEANSAPAPSDQLGTQGGQSNSDLYRGFRYNRLDLESTVKGELGSVVIQDGGMRWLELRGGPLQVYGGYSLLGMLAVLLVFFLIRGRIMIEGQKTGETVLRFRLLERVAHWSMAIPFVFLALTGLISLFGRTAIIPLIGRDAFSIIATGSKYIHNFIAWVFIAGLILSFFLWAWKNLPDRYDLPWLLKGGGLFSKGVHPSAGKFNAGEKIIFWVVIWFGVAISVTGVALLLPFQIQMFTPIYEGLNATGIAQAVGLGELNTALAPQEEMQLTQLWHAIIAFAFMSVILAHIYLGSVGMEGALDSMTKGTVDVQWAKEHHDKWYEEMTSETVKKQSDTAQS